MFFLLATLSMLAYTIQSVFLVKYARKMDSLSLSIYRNVSLMISMLPLLLGANMQDFQILPQFLPEMFLACITGAISLSVGLETLKYLPIGISTTFKTCLNVIFFFIFGFLFFRESISWSNVFWVGIILLGGIWLALQKHHLPHLNPNTRKGICLCMISALFTSLSFIFMSKISKELDPFIAGYFWEFGIGICAILLAVGKISFSSYRIEKSSWSKFGKILLISSPILIGTGAFAYAVTLGPIGIVGAISASNIFVSLIFAHFWYHEKITFKQWIIIAVMVIGIVGLKIFN